MLELRLSAAIASLAAEQKHDGQAGVVRTLPQMVLLQAPACGPREAGDALLVGVVLAKCPPRAPGPPYTPTRTSPRSFPMVSMLMSGALAWYNAERSSGCCAVAPSDILMPCGLLR